MLGIASILFTATQMALVTGGAHQALPNGIAAPGTTSTGMPAQITLGADRFKLDDSSVYDPEFEPWNMDDESNLGRRYSRHQSRDGALTCVTFVASAENAMHPVSGTYVVDRRGRRRAYFNALFDGSWAPNGDLLLAGTCGATGATPHEPGLFVVRKNTTTPQKIAVRMTPADAKRLTEVARARRHARDARAIESINGTPTYPAVSPDGRQVAFILQGELFVAPVGGGTMHLRTLGLRSPGAPAWSPDGRQIKVRTFMRGEIAVDDAEEETHGEGVNMVIPSSGTAPVDVAWAISASR